MAKYILTPTGEVKKYDKDAPTEWNISDFRLPNKLDKENANNSNKFSEYSFGGGLLFSPDVFSPQEGISNFPAKIKLLTE